MVPLPACPNPLRHQGAQARPKKRGAQFLKVRGRHGERFRRSDRVSSYHEISERRPNDFGRQFHGHGRGKLCVEDGRAEFGRFRELFEPAQDGVSGRSGETLRDQTQDVAAGRHIEQQREEEPMLGLGDGSQQVPQPGAASERAMSDPMTERMPA